MTKVTVDTLGIPRNVLFNRVRGFGKVHQTYKVILYTEYLKKIHQSYADRAFWGTDEYGNTWKQLSIFTDVIKEEELYTQEPHNEDDAYHDHREGFSQPQFPANMNNPTEERHSRIDHKRKLAPQLRVDAKRHGSEGVDMVNQLAVYRERLANYKKYNDPKSIRQRARKALKDMPKIEGGERKTDFGTPGRSRSYRRTPINIRSGRLFAAFSPGEVANNRIYPASPDQTFYLDGLKFGFNVDKIPYAEHVEAGTQLSGGVTLGLDGEPKLVPKRVLIEASLEPGGPAFMDCHRIAIQAARVVYDQLLNNNTKREERSSNDREHPPAPRRRPS